MSSAPASRQPLSPAVAEQRGAIEAIALQILTEVLSDSAVTRAIATTEREAVPWYTQMAAAAGREIVSEEEEVPGAEPFAAGGAVTRPPPAAVAAAPYGGYLDGEETPRGEHDISDPAVAAVSLGEESAAEAQMEQEYRMARAQRRAAEVERKRREAEESQKVRSASEFQELVAYVLEGTLFNLVSEVSLGEFALDTVPRQIVRSLEITQEVPGAVDLGEEAAP